MFRYFVILCCALTACAATPAQRPVPTPRIKPAHIHTPELSRAERFALWRQDFSARAIAKGYDGALVKRTIGAAKINPKAISANKTQPEFTQPIWVYIGGVVSDARVNGGRAKLSAHSPLFDTLEQRYGVDRHVLTAIWGLETAYGKIMGDENMINSLATLAFEGRRRAFGENQLLAILDLLSSGDVRQTQLTGSWAGAMGMTQFIPTTFRDYAVDFDQNGNKDLWKNPGDALASTANYLQHFGWRAAEPVFTEVVVPAGFDYGLSDGRTHTITGWAELGITPIAGKTWSDRAKFLEAKLLLPAGAQGPAFLVFKNFDVIMKYNNSTAYALGIGVLSEKLQGKTAITHAWPLADKALNRTQKKALQTALTAQGFDTGGVDGLLGPKSRRAVRAWQKAHNFPADGYVNQALLNIILATK